jgi:hypothetical protein
MRADSFDSIHCNAQTKEAPMEKKEKLTRILAIVGTILVWIPLVLPIVFGVIHFAGTRRFLVDFLMPGELFPVIAVGGGLLLWAAFRSGKCKKYLLWASAAAVFFLFASLEFAQISGIASGKTEEAGLPMIGLWTLWAIFCLSVVALGVGGIRLIRKLAQPVEAAPIT